MNFFATYVPAGERPAFGPVEHQQRALDKLGGWFDGGARQSAGGLLVVPTGGGKTFIAIRFACQHALSKGYKVLWLAHTHHLLEQAFVEFQEGAKVLAPSKTQLRVRVTSGAEGHWDPSRVEATDDVVIGTLQSVSRGLARKAPGICEFVEAAGDKLLVIFDEAHHSPARTYRKLLLDLREANPETYILGLTATPTYTDEKKRGWLGTLFPDGIVYQVRADELMARGILARPKFEPVDIDFAPDFDPDEYRQWIRTNKDLPESVIAQLASSRERNEFIAQHYASNRERYGKTIIFVDRWPQAVMVEELLKSRGVRAGSMFSQLDLGGTAAERNRRTRDENDKVLAAFKNGELDVVVNIRMLTEGTDVPDAETVFLTRQTRSRILLTQMIGRALRGPQFGGTADANVVSFVDDWRELINWAEWTEIFGGVDDSRAKDAGWNRLQLVRIDLVRRLAHQMDHGQQWDVPYIEMLPLGWYRVEYEFSRDGDETDDATEFLVVFQHQRDAYEAFLDEICSDLPAVFCDEAMEPAELTRSEVDVFIRAWGLRYFDGQEDAGVEQYLLSLARHVAQHGERPPFDPFTARRDHDLDELARRVIEEDMGPRSERAFVTEQYEREDRLWSSFYFDASRMAMAVQDCINRILNPNVQRVTNVAPNVRPPDRELSEELKAQVKSRDGRKCLCCGSTYRLVVDHVVPFSQRGETSVANSQTLCSRCNENKGDHSMDFRSPQPAETVGGALYLVGPPRRQDLGKVRAWEQSLRKSFNLFYGCAAVTAVHLGDSELAEDSWHIVLADPVSPKKIVTSVESMLDEIHELMALSDMEELPGTLIVEHVSGDIGTHEEDDE